MGPFLRPPTATFSRPGQSHLSAYGGPRPSGRLRPPHMHTMWRPEEFWTLLGGPKLDKWQFGSDTPPSNRPARWTSPPPLVRACRRPDVSPPAADTAIPTAPTNRAAADP